MKTTMFLVSWIVMGSMFWGGTGAEASPRTLSALFPSQRYYFDAALNATLSAIPRGSLRDAGIGAGVFVAGRILNARRTDGWDRILTSIPGD